RRRSPPRRRRPSSTTSSARASRCSGSRRSPRTPRAGGAGSRRARRGGCAVLALTPLAENPKSWSDAIAHAQQGAFLDPTNPLVNTAVGKIFETSGQYEQGAGAYREAGAAG